MNDNVVKFERRKPKPEEVAKKKPSSPPPGPRKGMIWLVLAAVIVLAWAYYQFIAPQSL